jgi:multiple sugar transport system substrate-binding protein
LCKTVEEKGVTPIRFDPTGPEPLLWFDYLNLRVNGAKFHRDVLSGRKSFNSPEIKAVFDKWAEMLPYMYDKQQARLGSAETQLKFYRGETATYLAAKTFVKDASKDVGDDIDFFQFPVIDPKIPVAEESETDGFIASAKGSNLALTKAFLKFLASPEAQETYLTTSGNSSVPASAGAKAAETAQFTKGRAMLAATPDHTQFFGFDGGPELIPSALAALSKFIDNPGDADSIMVEWQAAAVNARRSPVY